MKKKEFDPKWKSEVGMKRIDREKGRRTIYAHRGPEQTARIVRFSIDLCLVWIIRFAMRGRRFRSIDFHPFERDVLSQIHASTSLESIQSSQIAVEKWVKRIEGGAGIPPADRKRIPMVSRQASDWYKTLRTER